MQTHGGCTKDAKSFTDAWRRSGNTRAYMSLRDRDVEFVHLSATARPSDLEMLLMTQGELYSALVYVITIHRGQ